MLRLGEAAIVQLMRFRKARIAWLDPDAKELRITFHERQGNEVIVGKGEKGRRYILQGEAKLSGRYPTWVLDPKKGWNYRAPTLAESVLKEPFLAQLSVVSPEMYYHAVTHNDYSDALQANQDKDKWGWVMPVAIFGCIALVAILGMVVFLVIKFTGGAGGPAPVPGGVMP